jgi:hypothetical protein
LLPARRSNPPSHHHHHHHHLLLPQHQYYSLPLSPAPRDSPRRDSAGTSPRHRPSTRAAAGGVAGAAGRPETASGAGTGCLSRGSRHACCRARCAGRRRRWRCVTTGRRRGCVRAGTTGRVRNPCLLGSLAWRGGESP